MLGAGGGWVLSTAREVGDKGRQAAACRILALLFYQAGDYVQSIESSKRRWSLQGKRETEREASVCGVLARSYLHVGGYKQSIEYGKNREREIYARSCSYYEVGDYPELTKRTMWQTSPEYWKGSRKQKKKGGRVRCSSLAKHGIEYGKQFRTSVRHCEGSGEQGAGSWRVLCFGQVVIRD